MNSISELFTEVKLWSERTDISDEQLRSFTGMVEDDFKGEFYLPINEVEVDLVTDASSEIDIPTDFLMVKRITSVGVDGNEYIIFRKPNDIAISNKYNPSSGPDAIMFERRLSKLFFAPSPGLGMDIKLTYYSLIPSLVSTTSLVATNPVLEILPAVYLFGVLMMVHRWTYNEERADYYERLYEKAKKDFVQIQEKAEMAGSRLAVYPSISE